jgi:hypothetical protein
MYGPYDKANLKHGRNLNPGIRITQRVWSVGQASNLNCSKIGDYVHLSQSKINIPYVQNAI